MESRYEQVLIKYLDSDFDLEAEEINVCHLCPTPRNRRGSSIELGVLRGVSSA